MNSKLLQLGKGNSEEDKQIREMSLEEAYNEFILVCSTDTKEYNYVRYGIDIKFDIYNYFRENMKIYTKKELCVIHKKIYKLEDIYTELENRTKIMKKVLIEAIKKNSEITEMRGIEQLMKTL